MTERGSKYVTEPARGSRYTAQRKKSIVDDAVGVIRGAMRATQPFHDVSLMLQQGASFGMAPVISGAASALTGGRYSEGVARERGELSRIRERRPVSSALAEAFGGVATGGMLTRAAVGAAPAGVRAAGQQLAARVAPRAVVPSATAAGRAANLAGQAGRFAGRTALAAGAGGAAGAVYGAGEGGFIDAQPIVQNAAMGAIGGAVAEPIARGVAGAARGAARIVGAPVGDPMRRPAQMMLRRMSPDAQAQINEAQRLGLDPLANLDVLTQRGKGAVRAAAALSEDINAPALAYGRQTVEALPDRAQRIVEQMTGGPVDLTAAQEAGQRLLRETDRANYGPLSQDLVEMTPEMTAALRTEDGQLALLDAARTAENYGDIEDAMSLRALYNRIRGQTGREPVAGYGAVTPETQPGPAPGPAPREPAAPRMPQQPVTLGQFVRAGGGINPASASNRGDLMAALDRTGYAGITNRQTGRDLDRVREAAVEAGYLSPDAGIDDLIQALRREAGGDPVYSMRDMSQVSDYETALAARVDENQAYDQAMDAWREEMQRLANDPFAGSQPVTLADLEAQAGFPGAGQPIPFENRASSSSLDRVYQALRDRGQGLFEQTTTRGRGAAVQQQARRFEEALQAVSPAVRQARAASAPIRRANEALDVGYQAFNPTVRPDQIRANAAALGPLGMPNMRVGGQARLQQQLGEKPAGVINAIADRPNMLPRLEAMGAPAEPMIRAARIEQSRLRNAQFIQPTTGARTAPMAQEMSEMTGVGLPMGPGALINKLANFAFRRVNSLSAQEIDALAELGIQQADLPRLQALAARSPDLFQQEVRRLIGQQAAISGE
jgi:hypothetical protein